MMDTQAIEMERDAARAMWLKYKTHKHYSKPIDTEIQRIFELIAKGKVVIRALESIRKAGLNRYGLPKLALVRADAKRCYLDIYQNGAARMSAIRWPRANTAASQTFGFETGTFTGCHTGSYEAIVPLIPPDIRPQRGLPNYHILFEAEWSRLIPVDPMLLRRIGKGDSWLVCGAWELTEVERAVLGDRMRATQ
jgi:hypothetical protein